MSEAPLLPLRMPVPMRTAKPDAHQHRLRPAARRTLRPGTEVTLGAPDEPYPPEERTRGRMREALRDLARGEGLRVTLTTRSTLVLRDLDLLAVIARRSVLEVGVPIATPDRRLARLLEPGVPAPSVRVATLRRLRAAGIRAGVLLGPVIPGVTDLETDLRALLRSVRAAGAAFVRPRMSFPDRAARRRLLRDLRRRYPRVAARFEVRLCTDRRLPDEVGEELSQRLAGLLREFGLGEDGARPAATSPPPLLPLPSLSLPSQRVFEFVA